MRRILAILGGALRIWYRSKHTLFWTLAFPVLLMLLFGAIFSVSQNPTFDLHLQNQDIVSGEPTPLSLTFCNMLNETGIFNLHMVDATENTTLLIEEEGIGRMLIIPYGFEAGCINQNASIILKMVPPEVDTTSATVLSVVDGVVEMFNAV